jgi:glutamate synthase domain-containing protein 2/glutamate synthase domain-containing protein 1/glutamate synthase domain-containing protein 3/ferredoxin
MSFGSISFEAHTDIAEAANRIALALQGRDPRLDSVSSLLPTQGPFSNSGEGGEDPSRTGTLWASRIRQVASGRFGVTGPYLAGASQLQIKISQGAKPGIGGELPGHKVTLAIAKARSTTAGVRLVSPPPHHDIYSIEDLKQLIHDLRSSNPEALISVKLAASAGVGVIAAGVAKCGADNISIAGPGGTGAAPTTAKYEFVHDWETSLAEVHSTLVQEGLRDSVTLTVSGGLQTGNDLFKSLCLGADSVEFGTQILVSLGCTMAQVCHKGTCPVGIATTDQELISSKYKGTPMMAARVLVETARSLARLLAKYGLSDPAQAVGRRDLLEIRPHAPLTGLDTALLSVPRNPFAAFGRVSRLSGSSLTEMELISRVSAGERSLRVRADNQDLSFGARFAYHAHSEAGAPSFKAALQEPDGVTVDVRGVAPGQSFGFVCPEGLTLLADAANDGTGKSLDGGTVMVRGTAGNQSVFGGTSGFFAARFSGDRSFVRNSGTTAIVEWLGQMGANFMTGGSLTVLGSPSHYGTLLDDVDLAGYVDPVMMRPEVVGANFGAGMSGGKAIFPRALYDSLVRQHYLADSVADLVPVQLSEEERAELKAGLERFAAVLTEPSGESTAQTSLAGILASLDDEAWAKVADTFVKLEPTAASTAPNELEFTPRETYTPLSASASALLTPAAAAAAASHALDGTTAPMSAASEEALEVASTVSEQQGAAGMERDACGTGVILSRRDSPSHATVAAVCTMLARLEHRGARGIDPGSGDGCGIALFGTAPFFAAHFPDMGLAEGNFAVVTLALPRDDEGAVRVRTAVAAELEREGLSVACERSVPTNSAYLGYMARMREPAIVQLIVARPTDVDLSTFERRLTRARLRFDMLEHELDMQAARAAADEAADHGDDGLVAPSFTAGHIVSASAFHVVYKALCNEGKLAQYYPDLSDTSLVATAAVPHSRFATNTLPQFKNVQPLPRFANNGENNALVLVRRALQEDPVFAELLDLPSLNVHGSSDSAIMGFYMDCLYLLGASAEDIVRLTVLGYDATGTSMASEYLTLFSLPFEGPNASIVLVEGDIVVVRDKNGFRPQRGVISDDWLYSGSELGAMAGLKPSGIFDLPPAVPLRINVPSRTFALVDDQLPAAKKALSHLRTVTPSTVPYRAPGRMRFAADDILLRKRRAGWTREVHERVLLPLFQLGKGATESMGDQGPMEALVRGSMFDISNFFKGTFSQVTNPPLARNEEQAYMSTETHVGAKPPLGPALARAPTVSGVFLPSPVVDNSQLAALVADGRLRAVTLDTTFDVMSREAGLSAAIDRVRSAALAAAGDGAQLIVLSDVETNDDRAPIPPVLAAAVVDRALRRAGLRRSASIAVQGAAVLSGVHIAQCISVGGADIVNPYLIFLPESSGDEVTSATSQLPPEVSTDQATVDAAHEAAFAASRANYLKAVRQDLLGFMARMGISTVSAYRGCKGFTGIGLDPEVAALYGVQSTLGGLSLQDVSRILLTNHRFVLEEGLGKYEWIDQEPRKPIWNTSITNAVVKAGRGTDPLVNWADIEKQANILKSGWPRGWCKLRPSRAWSKENPLVVCVLGGGAAGFYQAQELLNTSLPVRVVIIERQHVNKFGLLGDGIAPDHAGTKRSGSILRELYEDPRVKYYGGIEVGRRVTVDMLREKYPVIVDCRGASQDVRLGVAGEHVTGVLPASRVYAAYNNEFDPMGRQDWPFMIKSKNPVLGIVGGGNVAADVARIFVKDPDELASTGINPVFLDYLRFEGPHVVRIFVRSDPWKVKMSLKELRELKDTGVWMSASFTPPEVVDGVGGTGDHLASLTPQERELYDFFAAIKDRRRQARDAKRVYFHFQVSPTSFRQIGTEVEATFSSRVSGETYQYRASNFVTALGKEKPPALGGGVYVAGWATGKGGTLKLAEESAASSTRSIETDFYSGKFDSHMGDPERDEPWQLRAVSNEEALSILRWLDEGRELRTVSDFRAAKQWAEARIAAAADDATVVGGGGDAGAAAGPGPAGASVPQGSPTGPTIVLPSDAPGSAGTVLGGAAEQMLLAALRAQLPDAVPDAECDGELTCGTCFLRVLREDPAAPIQRTRKEIALLKANNVDPKTHLLSCTHCTDELMRVVLAPQ